jgi:hypothetical protein
MLGVEVFPEAEVRLVHGRGLKDDSRVSYLQIVGGSSWQPTGLRR